MTLQCTCVVPQVDRYISVRNSCPAPGFLVCLELRIATDHSPSRISQHSRYDLGNIAFG